MRDLKIFAETVEKSATDQIDLLLAQKPFENCKIRIMPDVHAGAGCVIGFTADLGDKVIPNIVGVDIGCGMLTVELGKIDIDFDLLDRVIRQYVPSGMAVHETPGYVYWIDKLICKDKLKNLDRLHSSLGTLGGGNHFIEIDADDQGNKYLIIHSGSRNLGKQVAEIYQDMAINNLHSGKAERAEIIARLKAEGREHEISAELAKLKVKAQIPKDLCYLEGQDRENYLHDMVICQLFASHNRQAIAREICGPMDWLARIGNNSFFETIHNYIDNSNMVRKGAISAQLGEKVLIPINMRDGCIIGIGKGNPDWNCSAPHGAGRIMSRMEAKKTLRIEDYKESMKGIFTTSVDENTIDEAPQVYKPIDEIVRCISDTVDIVKIIKPLYNFKAGD